MASGQAWVPETAAGVETVAPLGTHGLRGQPRMTARAQVFIAGCGSREGLLRSLAGVFGWVHRQWLPLLPGSCC